MPSEGGGLGALQPTPQASSESQHALPRQQGQGMLKTRPEDTLIPARRPPRGHLRKGEIDPDSLSVLAALPLVFFASKIGQPPAMT